jgi:hypothetical protein
MCAARRRATVLVVRMRPVVVVLVLIVHAVVVAALVTVGLCPPMVLIGVVPGVPLAPPTARALSRFLGHAAANARRRGSHLSGPLTGISVISMRQPLSGTSLLPT